MRNYLSFIIFCLFICTGLNVMTREKMEYAISNNYTVLALWNSQNCITCANHMWDVYRAIFSFLDEPKFIVLATTVGMDESLDIEYQIDDNEGGTHYRLLLPQVETPLVRKETDEPNDIDLISWIAQETHFVPQHDYASELTPEHYDSFFTKYSHRNIIVMYYIPNYQKAQVSLVQYLRAALAFRIEPIVSFVRVNCAVGVDLCQDKNIKDIPTFMFYPANTGSSKGQIIETSRGEGLVTFLNNHLDTLIDPKGGYNEKYGRETDLDRLAHSFITNKNEKQQKRLIKETAKLRKRYHATVKYYKIMKAYMKDGPQVIMKELTAVRMALKNVKFEDAEYPSLRARENIIHQFEPLTTENSVVHLNPWSFDNVVNSYNDVIVLFYTSWCQECQNIIKDMEKEVETLHSDVIFATVNAQTYVDFCASFHIDHFPCVKFYKAGTDTQKPVDVAVSEWNDIKEFVKQQDMEKEL